MLFTSILDLFVIVINGILNFLPSPETLPASVDSSISAFLGILAKLNNIFPVDTLFIILNIILVIELSLLVFQAIDWIYTKIRG